MPTPDFEEWLARQDIPIEATLTKEKYMEYLTEQFDLSGGTLDVAERMYEERYNILEQLEVRPFKWHTTVWGVRYAETRYAITGLRGAFGRDRAYEIAIERAREQAWTYAADWLERKRELYY